MLKFFNLLILLLIAQKSTWASNSYLSYGDLDNNYLSSRIVIECGDEILEYELQNNKILFYKIPLNTKFRIQGMKTINIHTNFNGLDTKTPRMQDFLSKLNSLQIRNMAFVAPVLLGDEMINSYVEALNDQNPKFIYRPELKESSFSEVKAILPDNKEYLLVKFASENK